MLAKHSARVGWYLGLRGVVRFPKTFLAPIVGLVRSRTRGVQVSDRLSETARSVTGGVNIEALRPRTNNSIVTGIKYLSPKSLETNTSRPVRSGAALSTGPLPYRPVLMGGYGTPIAAGSPSANFQNYRPIRIPTREPATASGRHHFHPPSDIKQVATRAKPFTAEVKQILLTNRSSQNEQSLAPPSAVRKAGDLQGNPFRDVSGSQRPSLNKVANESQVELGNQKPDGPEAKPGGQNVSVSTLHIDGSTLGRWALQHLERSLGKPASGMTGIDPRATLPRTRVAPF